jgi:hypothetical protein
MPLSRAGSSAAGIAMVRGEREGDFRPRAPVSGSVERLGIRQDERASVFLDDLLDDGEPEPGALLARGHIGLEERRAVFRQADAVVGDGDHRAVVALDEAHLDRGVMAFGRAPIFQGCQWLLPAFFRRLVSACPIIVASRSAASAHPAGRWTSRVLAHGAFLQEDRVAHERHEVARLALGFGHPGEFGEFVDDAAEIPGLADDDLRILLERRRILSELSRELAPDALGRELDRRERVLDLVRDAAGDIAPGGHALGRDEVGHVVECQHVTLHPPIGGAAGRDAYEEALDLAPRVRRSSSCTASAFVPASRSRSGANSGWRPTAAARCRAMSSSRRMRSARG